jgi:hypothetical protein
VNARSHRWVTLGTGIGAIVGAIVGCGLLGLLGLGFTVYFAAWLGDELWKLGGETARQVGMIVGFLGGFTLYVGFWLTVGGLVGRGLERLGTGRKGAA